MDGTSANGRGGLGGFLGGLSGPAQGLNSSGGAVTMQNGAFHDMSEL